MIRDLSSEAAESSRRWLTQVGCRWSQEHAVVLKCDIILPSVGGKWITFQAENIINEKPWQFREIIVNDKSKVNNIDIDMTWIQGLDRGKVEDWEQGGW